MKIVKTPSGSFRTVLYIGTDITSGKKIYKTITAKTKPLLKAKVNEIQLEYSDSTVDSDSFYMAATQFMENKKPTVSENTYKDYKSRLRTLTALDKDFVDKSVANISASDIQKIVNTLLSEHTMTYIKGRERKPTEHKEKPLSAKTVWNYWGFINSVLKANGRTIKAPSMPQKQLPDIYVPTDTEMQIILSHAEGELLTCIKLAAFGPLREGEICALQTSDIKGNVIHVHRDIVYHDGGGYSTKSTAKTSRSNRYIEMPDDLIKEIMDRGYVTHYSPKMLRYEFKKLLSKCEVHDFRFHDLRHYCASTLHAQGLPDAYVMKRGGWATDATLKSVYRHTLADQDKIFTEMALNHFKNLQNV